MNGLLLQALKAGETGPLRYLHSYFIVFLQPLIAYTVLQLSHHFFT